MTTEQRYICVCVYEATSDATGFETLYEERFLIFRASADDEAWKKAERLTQDASHEYVNVDGNNVRWTCKYIVDVAATVDDSFDDGSEMYGRYFRDLEAYEHFEPRLKGKSLE